MVLFSLILLASTAPPQALEQVCATRGMPTREGDSPARHYRLIGNAHFAVPSGVFNQPFQAALAGPAKQRYTVTSQGDKNLFLLADPKHAWVKKPGEDTQEYDAAELHRDAWARWLVLRFPWDHPASLAGSALPSDPIALTAPGGWQAVLQLDAQGLPQFLQLQSPDAAQVERLELSEWQRSSPQAVLFPHRWHWVKSWGQLTETVTTLDDGVLYYDEAFRPSEGPPPEYTVLRLAADAKPENATETIDLRLRSLVWIPHEIWQLARLEPPPGQIWEIVAPDGSRRRAFVPDDGAAALPAGLAPFSIDQQLVLAWQGWRALDENEGRQRLLEAAARNGLKVTGPMWQRVWERSYEAQPFEWLLPVTRD